MTTSIQTIFWDIGGVLLSNGFDTSQRTAVLGPLGVDLPAYEIAHERENALWERGLITAEEFFNRTVFAPNSQLGLTFAQLWPLVCAQSTVLDPQSVAILRSLAASPEYTVATLNNESRELNAYRLDAFDLRRSFRYLICSGYIHEMKPAARIYADAIDISGSPAGATLFIDDKQENCDAAIAAGMQAIRFDSPAQLRTELTGLGITV